MPQWTQAAHLKGLFDSTVPPAPLPAPNPSWADQATAWATAAPQPKQPEGVLDQTPAPHVILSRLASSALATAKATWQAWSPKTRIGVGAGAGVILLILIGLAGSGDGSGNVGKLESTGAGPALDFSRVDYSIPEVDYSKGPHGEQVVERDGGWDKDERNRPVTEQGFLDANGTFVLHGLRTLWYEKQGGQLHGTKKFAEEHWYNGKLHGTLTSWDEQGQKRLEKHYRDGEQHGNVTVWFGSGKKKAEGYWFKGQQHGLFKDWFESGRQAAERSFTNGAKNGKWLAWYESGKPKSDEHFVNGKQHGKQTWWHENGQKAKEFVSENGLAQGQYTEWHENGQKANEGIYKDGKEEGKWVRWYTNGQKLNEVEFVGGKQTGAQTDWYPSGDMKGVTMFMEGIKLSTTVFWPPETLRPDGKPLGPGHTMYEYRWTILPGDSRVVPDGDWIDYWVQH